MKFLISFALFFVTLARGAPTGPFSRPWDFLFEQNRASKFTLRAEGGNQNFFASDLEGAWGVSPTLQLESEFHYMNQTASYRTYDLDLGGNWMAATNYLLKGVVDIGRGPSGMRTLGGQLENHWGISELWHGKRQTALSLGVFATDYSEFANADTSIMRAFHDVGFILGVTQEWTERVQMGISYTVYNYDVSTDLLQQLATYTIRFPGIAGYVNGGLPKNAVTATLELSVSKKTKLDALISRILTVNSGVPAWNEVLEFHWDATNRWSFGWLVGDYDSSGTTPSYSGGLETSYSW